MKTTIRTRRASEGFTPARSASEGKRRSATSQTFGTKPTAGSQKSKRVFASAFLPLCLLCFLLFTAPAFAAKPPTISGVAATNLNSQGALIGWTTGVKLHDYGCTLKAYRANLLKPLELYSDMHRFMPALASRTGARIAEVVVSHRARLHGSSKYGLNRVVKVAFDLLTIQMIVHFSNRPMHFFGVASIVFLLLSVVATGFWAGNLAVNYDWSIVLPTIIVLFFVSFLYFLFLGLLAELVNNVGRSDRTDFARSSAEVL